MYIPEIDKRLNQLGGPEVDPVANLVAELKAHEEANRKMLEELKQQLAGMPGGNSQWVTSCV